jgi:hypothetical protein
MNSQIRWSDKTIQDKDYLVRVNDLYKRGLELVEGKTLRGYTVNLNNPKEVIAILYLLAMEYDAFHER